MTKYIYLFLFFISFQIYGQRTIKGKLTDSETNVPLAFANLSVSDDEGTISNAEGFFNISVSENVKEIEITYIGYETKTIHLQPDKNYYNIQLEPQAETLDVLVISGKYVNPAIALMQRIIKEKPNNDYRKKIKKYSFTKYYKFLVTADSDSINGALDSIYHNGKFAKIDSSMYETKKHLEDKDMFLMESVLHVNTSNGIEKNNVIASRTAGFKNSMYELLAMQVSNQNVYDDNYKFLIKKYLGPITKLSLKQYQYEIDDSITIQNRKVYVISYKNTVKPLISGKLYIDKNSLAIAKMTLNTYEQFELQTTHEFTYYPKHDAWMPKQSKMHIKKAKKKDKLVLGDGMFVIRKNKENDSISHSNKGNSLDHIYAKSKTLISELSIGTLHNEKITYNLQVTPDSNKKSKEFWDRYKDHELSERDQNTYQYVDSIAKEDGVEKKIYTLRKLATGYYPFGVFDADLVHLLDKNEYEGYRISLGGKTNEKLSNRISLSGYVAYGFKDKELKYKAKTTYKLRHLSQTYTHFSYTNDLKPIASFGTVGSDVFTDVLNYTSYDKFYKHQSYELGLSHLLANTLKVKANYKYQDLEQKFMPRYVGQLKFRNSDAALAQVKFEFDPFSKFYLDPNGRNKMKDGYPKLYFNIEKNIPAWQESNADFYRLDFQSVYKKTYLNKHYSEAFVRFGYASQQAPFHFMYAPSSNSYDTTGQAWYNKVHTSFNSNFETMNNLEFVDNFVSILHLSHTFSSVKVTEKFNFDLALKGRAAWGLSHSNRYLGVQSMRKGYFETGLELNNLLKISLFGFGVGAYYSLGEYAYENPMDNLSVKITFKPSALFN